MSKTGCSIDEIKRVRLNQEIQTKDKVIAVLDVSRSVYVTVKEAIERNLINLALKKFYDTSTNETVSLDLALDKKWVLVINNGDVVGSTCIKVTRAPAANVLRSVKNSKTGHVYSYAEGVEKGLLRESVLVYNNMKEEWVSLEEAFDKDLVNMGTCQSDPTTVGFSETAERKIVIKGALNTVTRDFLNFEDAVATELIDLQRQTYNYSQSGMSISLLQAIEEGLVVVYDQPESDTIVINKSKFSRARHSALMERK